VKTEVERSDIYAKKRGQVGIAGERQLKRPRRV
jgi:hypothetical protein